MAITFDSTSLLSKVKLGDNTYNLKDAEARTKLTTLVGEHALEALGNAAWKGYVTTLTGATDNETASAKAVKDYVDSAVAAIPDFDVVVIADGEDLPDASEETFHKIYLVKASGSAEKNIYKEYITVRSAKGTTPETYDYTWEMIGDTAIDISSKVDKTQKIAGVDLQDDIAKEELQTALGLKSLAYADSAKGTVEAQTIQGVKATGDVESNITVAHTSTSATLTTSDYTPAGTISAHTPAGSVSVTLKDATTATNATVSTEAYTPAGTITTKVTAAGEGQTANYTPAGSVSAPTITTTDTKENVQVMKESGTNYTITTGSVEKANDTSAAFAKEGLKASIDETDAEMLVFTNAETTNAVTTVGGITYTAPTLSGSLPTFESKAVVVGTSATATAPAFTGTGVVIADTFSGTEEDNLKVTSVTYNKQEVSNATFTGTEFQPTFTGTEIKNFQVTGVTYDKANASQTAKAENVSLTVGDITVTSKEVTVSPVTA